MSTYSRLQGSEIRAIYRNITRVVQQLKPKETLFIRDFELEGGVPNVYYNLRGTLVAPAAWSDRNHYPRHVDCHS